MTDVIKEDQVLDCSGMLCPMPVVKTSKAMKELQSGQILKMVATDPGAPRIWKHGAARLAMSCCVP